MKRLTADHDEQIETMYASLRSAYKAESEMEQNLYWEAHLSSEPELRALLLRLSYDSLGHKAFLEHLFTKLRGFSYERSKVPSPETAPKFTDLKVDDLLSSIRSSEVRMMEGYLQAKHGASDEALKKIWLGEDPHIFRDMMEYLVNAERLHDTLLKAYLQNMKKGE